jgi:2-polyprenyl-3-methyl-5-hydroxy-6-metoxy-1,4-benzoquinol methylase
MKWFDRALQGARLRKITPYISHETRLLDIGCADGALCRRVGQVRRYVGIDPDAPTMELTHNMTFIRDVFPTAVLNEQERFDVVAVTAVLEHIPAERQSGFAHACASCLVRRGRLLITVPSPWVDMLLALLKRAKVLDGMKEDEHYGYDPSRTPGIFEAHGFELERHSRFELGLNHLFVFRRI